MKSCRFLSLNDAEKILGQRSELITSSRKAANDKTIFDCTYRTFEKDKTSGQEINLFFLLEESPTEEQAKKIYADIWESNKNHAGIEVISGTGDEAYLHSEKPNFHLVSARKGKFTLRMKVNKAVETTSLEELKKIAKKIIEEI